MCCDFKIFLLEIDHWKTHPPNFIDSCNKICLNNLYRPKVIVFRNISIREVFLKFFSLETLCFKFERSFKNYILIE